jgi:hypothetical protein
MPGLDASSWFRYFTWWHHSGRQNRGLMNWYIDAWYAQGNILITQDGQACLGDFEVIDPFRGIPPHDHKLETVRYMAPERLPGNPLIPQVIYSPSRASDVYSLAMTSFNVCPSITNYPII